MSIDDRVADMQTIKRLQDRLYALSKVKEDLLAHNRELQEQISALSATIHSLDYERECMILDIHHLRSELDKSLK